MLYYTFCFRSSLSKLSKHCLVCYGSSAFTDVFQLFFSILRWLDTVFKNSLVFNTLKCSNYAFLGFTQQILGFLYILISLLSNYISFSNRYFVAMTRHTCTKFTPKWLIVLYSWKRSMVSLFYLDEKLTISKI